MSRLLSIVLAIANAQNGILLIDEVENGLHHSVLRDVWRTIEKASRRYNVQVFATTHSAECIDAAQSVLPKARGGFNLYRLDRRDGVVRATSYDRLSLAGALESGIEIR
jgi:AAA15 family ATPase/GTPase